MRHGDRHGANQRHPGRVERSCEFVFHLAHSRDLAVAVYHSQRGGSGRLRDETGMFVGVAGDPDRQRWVTSLRSGERIALPARHRRSGHLDGHRELGGPVPVHPPEQPPTVAEFPRGVHAHAQTGHVVNRRAPSAVRRSRWNDRPNASDDPADCARRSSVPGPAPRRTAPGRPARLPLRLSDRTTHRRTRINRRGDDPVLDAMDAVDGGSDRLPGRTPHPGRLSMFRWLAGCAIRFMHHPAEADGSAALRGGRSAGRFLGRPDAACSPEAQATHDAWRSAERDPGARCARPCLGASWSSAASPGDVDLAAELDVGTGVATLADGAFQPA